MANEYDRRFGEEALRAGILSAGRLADAWKLLERDGGRSLAAVLEERGWVTPLERVELERRLNERGSVSTSQHHHETRGNLAEVSQAETLQATASIGGASNGSGATSDSVMDETVDLLGAEDSRPSVEAISASVETMPMTLEAGKSDLMSDGGRKAGASSFSNTSNDPTIELPGPKTDDVEDQVTLGATGAEDGPGPLRLSALGAPLPESSESRYTMTRLHAKGGHGQVWRALDASLGREVALKELRGGSRASDQVWTRFVEEARITGQLEHPGIVPIYELGRRSSDGQPFYTMKFIRGNTLRDAVRHYHKERSKKGEVDPLVLRGLLDAFVTICQTMAYAHARGVLHRDLKTANIALGEYGEVMVLDWGLAKVLGRGEQTSPKEGEAGAKELSGFDLDTREAHMATHTGQVLGTPAYMAPEQAEGRNQDVDLRTDVYGLGAVLYEILTGVTPFSRNDQETMSDLLQKVRERLPRRPREVCPEVSPAIEAVCLKAIAKRPADRYQSASALAEEVRRFLADEPVEAFPEPFTKRLARWTKRHRTAVAAASVLGVTGLIALSTGYVLVSRERDDATAQRGVARRAVNDMYSGVADDWLEDTLDSKQKEFLELALDYYRNFSGRDAGSAEVRLETAMALGRIGDIQDKLGRNEEAETAYRESMAIIEALERQQPGQAEYRFQKARQEARLGGLLDAMGRRDEAEPLLISGRDVLGELSKAAPGNVSRAIELARAERGLASFWRIKRDNTEAARALARSVAALEGATVGQESATTEASAEARRDLGVTLDQQGTLQYEVGEFAPAVSTLTRAQEILDPLLAESPTNPRIRVALANATDSLARALIRTGAGDEAQARQQRALSLYQRLADDFPGRPEYRRLLSRGWMNLGTLFFKTGDYRQADTAFKSADAILTPLVEELADEPKVRRDLAVANRNLGAIRQQTGRLADAAKYFARAAEINEALAAQYPEVPDYRESLASVLSSQASVLDQAEGLEAAEAAQQRALELLEDLVEEHPDVAGYRESLASAMGVKGLLLSQAEGADARRRGEEAYRQSVGRYRELLKQSPGDLDLQDGLALNLNNLAELLIDGQRVPDAEALYVEAITRTRELAEADPDQAAQQLRLGTYELNLGELLTDAGRVEEGLAHFRQAEGLLDPLCQQASVTPETHFAMAYLQTQQGKQALSAGEAGAAQAHFERAQTEQRAYLEGVQLATSTSDELQEQIALLGRAVLRQGRYVEAAARALELPQAAPERLEARLEAAHLLAACVPLAAQDEQLVEEERALQAKRYGDRAIAQLRVALDAGYKPATPLEEDPDLQPLAGREDFRTLVAEISRQE